MKTGKITAITPDGSWSNGSKTFNRFKVTMADGMTYQFNAVGNFKFGVGEECTFTSEEKQYNGVTYHNAKLFSPPPAQGGFQKPAQGGQKTDAVQKYIIRQSSISSAVNFYKDKSGATEDQVITFAEKIVNYIYS